MPAPGRNDPCPCGSGRKFKQCHGRSAAGNGTPNSDDRAQAYDLLERMSVLPRFSADMHHAYEMIWQETVEEAADDPVLDTAAGDLFLEWSWFDFILHTGGTLATFTLEKHERDLTLGGRQFLRACTAAPLRLLQVTGIEPNVGVQVKDLIDRGRSIVVTERLGSQQLVPHDVLIGRIVAYTGEAQFEGVTMRVEVRDKARLAAEARRMRKILGREMPGPVVPQFLRMVTGAALLNGAIHLFDRDPPDLQTSDGDALVFANTVFRIVDREALVTALARAQDVVRDDETENAAIRYSWFDDHPTNSGDGPRRVLGSLVVRDEKLVIETMSMSRARHAQQYFGDLAPDALRFIAIDVTGFDEVRRRAAAEPPAPAIDPAIAEPIEREFMESHYRAWMDEPVPALGYRTPRAAATEKYWRPKVLALVEGIENQAARRAREGAGFDVTFLRPELGFRARR